MIWYMVESPVIPRTSAPRRGIGTGAAVLAGVVLLLSVAGAGHVGHYVEAMKWFGNPVRDLLVIFALALVAVWVGLKVHSEVAHPGRVRARIVLIVLTIAALLATVFISNQFFRFDARTVARQPGGPLRLADVTVGSHDGDAKTELHMITGTGLGARDVGNFGTPCGMYQVTFSGPGQITVVTSYDTIDLRFDPATGAPLKHLGTLCSSQ